MDDDEGAQSQRILRLRLDVYLDRRPISGRIHSQAGIDQRFSGWLELSEVLSRLAETHQETQR